MAAEDSSGVVSSYSNGAMASADYPQLWAQGAGGDVGMMPDSPLRGYRGTMMAPNGTGAIASPMAAAAAPMMPGAASSMPTNSASQRLFDVIEKAKERADARRLLTGAAEDVKVKAQALEELLANSENGL